MPFCSKCGTELDEDAKFCPKCGTPTGPPVTAPERRDIERRPMSILPIVLIAIIVIAAVAAALAFLPIRPVNVGPTHSRMSVPYKSGVDTLIFDLTAELAHVNIIFENLTGESQSPLIILNANASATVRVGIFGSADNTTLERFMPVWDDETEDNVLTVTVTQDVDTIGWPRYSSLNVTFDVHIDHSLKTSLDVKTTTGGIDLETQAGIVLDSLILDVTTGGVEAELVEDVIVAGNVSVSATTGGVELFWDDVTISDDVQVNAVTITGGVDVSITQEELSGNVTLEARATTGGVSFAIDIKGDVGAKIVSSVTTGGVDAKRRVGFSGLDDDLHSSNYPASQNFDVNLETVTGGIDIDAKHTP